MYRRLVFFIVAVALAGCNNEKVRNLIDQRADQATQGLRESRLPAPPKPYNPLTVTDRVWAGSASLRLRRGLPLPSKYEGARGVALISADTMSLNEIASTISTQTGIPIRIAAGTVPMGSSSSSSSSRSSYNEMPLAYEGPLTGLLDMVAGYFGINWKYDGASVNFSKYETRVFLIEALPGTQTIKDGVSESSSSGGSSGGSSSGSSGSGSGVNTNTLQQTSEMSVELKSWEELKETISSMLGGVGSVVVSPSNGVITVTTTPDLMRVVAKYIQEENMRQSRQIGINVEIYKVELEQGTDFQFRFDALLTKVSDDLKFTIGSVQSAPTQLLGGGSLSLAILNPTSGGNPYKGFFNALSTLGDTSRVAQFPLTTLNNRPVTRRVGRDRTYVASVENTTGTGTTSTSSVSITPGTVQEGFALQLTPRLLDDGRIMLQYSLSITDIVGITSFPEDATPLQPQVQLPETTNKVFVQQSMLKSGATLVIGGYDDEMAGQKAQGVGSPYNFFLGGGSNTSTTHSMLFMAITPQVLDTPRVEQE